MIMNNHFDSFSFFSFSVFMLFFFSSPFLIIITVRFPVSVFSFSTESCIFTRSASPIQIGSPCISSKMKENNRKIPQCRWNATPRISRDSIVEDEWND
ncbi:hypothetical protein BDV36DRAFT_199985 [Aspergillus pseudocaelatus]|uniref:Secreted protein n=1 Tax=Aspergillus pseudocaelatus TaxID=1825620 RepID=A0ABQ6WI09_9EURO|nr:hypothetical protein BDV36DRAFT_199985 [Aspergillus pseudocaelatus]